MYNESDSNFICLPSEVLAYYNLKKVSKYRNVYCVNCGEKGHIIRDCNGPITSFGIIAFKVVNCPEDEEYDKNAALDDIIVQQSGSEKYYFPKYNNEYPKIKFLMIQRKDTMGYTDFVRGKYTNSETLGEEIIKVCLNEMTRQEKKNLLTKTFDQIWSELWINHDSKCFKNEYEHAKKKYLQLDIQKLVKSSHSSFDFQEFGFPKGRRNMKETNISCAEREFYEETGYDNTSYDFIKNYPTIQEEFVGTNGVHYRHIYYLVKMKQNVSPPKIDTTNKIQTGEVQNIGWLTLDECMLLIRPYDTAKKSVIRNVYYDILQMKNNFVCSNFYYSNNKRGFNGSYSTQCRNSL
ncbi:NUDIX domain-containing protein [bacterium]|nr:NUDIX domain-containing protein [bacterium]NDC94031.1 NUDIX domain-containing protein [bacterium]NDD82717.1 NUDIX domain-containing protein [bacterium]NDG29138.1 NUDIX domain-containing protein [bacterium]